MPEGSDGVWNRLLVEVLQRNDYGRGIRPPKHFVYRICVKRSCWRVNASVFILLYE